MVIALRDLPIHDNGVPWSVVDLGELEIDIGVQGDDLEGYPVLVVIRVGIEAYVGVYRQCVFGLGNVHGPGHGIFNGASFSDIAILFEQDQPPIGFEIYPHIDVGGVHKADVLYGEGYLDPLALSARGDVRIVGLDHDVCDGDIGPVVLDQQVLMGFVVVVQRVIDLMNVRIRRVGPWVHNHQDRDVVPLADVHHGGWIPIQGHGRCRLRV